MSRIKNLLWFLVLTLSLCCAIDDAWAGAFLSLDQGQPSMGTAEAGQAALASDASTAYFNPAGMTRLEGKEVVFGGQLLYADLKFQHNTNNDFPGNDGGQAGGFFPGGGFYYVQKINSRLAVGLSINVPAGIGVDYDDKWKGRYLIQNNFLAIADINPAMAYKITNWLSIGAGFDVYYAFLNEEIALFNLLRPDGKIEIKFDDWALGGNIGLLFEPTKKTRIGLTYRSEADFELSGDIDFKNVGPIWHMAGLRNAFGKANLALPMNATLSLYQDITNKLAVLFDAGWQDWSSMEKTAITTGNGITIPIYRYWKDTWRVGLGLHYRITQPLLLKAGVSYDSNPVEEDHRLPDLPVDRQWKYALGFDYDLNKDLTLSVNALFIDTGKAPINKHFIHNLLRLSGDYDQYITTVGFSVRWRFGK